MRIIGKLTISLAAVISGSCIYATINQRDSAVQKYLPNHFKIPSTTPTALRFLGFLISHFPKHALDLCQSDNFYIRNLVHQALTSAKYPKDFDVENFLKQGPENTLISLARNPLTDEQYFDFNTEAEVLQIGDEKLRDAFRDLLSSLPSSGQDKCTKWFTESAFHGGKSGHLLYKTIHWVPGEEDHLDTVSSESEIPLFLKALRKHSEVVLHRSRIIKNNGLGILLLALQSSSDVKTVRLVAHIIGNLALDERSHQAIIKKGWIRQLRQWLKSEDIVIRSHALRALANLDRDGEKGFFYEDGIFVLYPLKQLKCCKPEVDVVFVHGLRGSPFKTWRSGDNISSKEIQTDCWPREWLPVDIPSCRVILIEYDSELSDWTSKCPLQPEISSMVHRSSELMKKLVNAGVGKRPVIWICHSMGGLLVKQLFVDAAKTHKFCSLVTSTKGVVFYAVPHRGSDVASLVSGKARYVLRPSFEVKELQKGSDLLENLHRNFVKCIKKGSIDVLSYGETEPSRIVRDTLIVPRESADIEMGEFIQLAANHYEVCKPSCRSHPAYIRTVLFIKEHMTKCDTDDYPIALLF